MSGPMSPQGGASPSRDGASGRAADAPSGPVVTPRTRTLSWAGLLTVVLLAVLVFLPAPFVVNSPGPTFDTLGTSGGKPVLQISGAKTYPTTGELRLVTVLEAGGPGFAVTLDQAVEGWFRKDTVILPRDLVFPPGTTQEQEQQESHQQMVSSQESATVAALTEVGYEVPAKLTIVGAVPGSGAEGVVEKGDVVTTFDGTKVTTYTGLLEALDDTTPGDTVTLGVTRDGASKDLSIATSRGSDGNAQLGVYIDPTFDFPVDVTINLANVGGPSAGLMFSLGIVDKLTPDDLAKGKTVAGTGTIDVDGTVGAIGGIRQKMVGARRDGATWFLAPKTNCDEVVGYVPDGMRVISVGTLHEAREDLLSIKNGTASGLPTCQGP